MEKDLVELFEKCLAFNTLNKIIRKEIDGDTFFALSTIYAILLNLYPDVDTSKGLMHNYLRNNFSKYNDEHANKHMDKIIEKGHNPVSCNTLIKKGYCKQQCKLIKNSKTPFALLLVKKREVIPNGTISKEMEFWLKYKLKDADLKTIKCLLLYYNGKDGVVFPSENTIAKNTGLNIRTVKDAIAKLNKLRLISIRKNIKNKGYANNIYTLSATIIDTYKPSLLSEIPEVSLIGERNVVSLIGEQNAPPLEPISNKPFKEGVANQPP